jgi:hypothetical protein
MTISARQMALFANFKVSGAVKWIFAVAVLAAVVGAPGSADARRARIVGGPGAYDGTWNVTFSPRAGNCSSTNTVPFQVYGRSVSSAGGGKVTGGIGPGGAVSVTIIVGASWANGSGRLAGNSGAGRWSGLITGDRCSGVWQASRS